MQLVSDKVEQFDPMSQKTYGIAEVVSKWGVAPGKMIDLQALTGDASDNIPGCPGIGPKTAAKMLEQFGSLDRLLENTERIEGRAVRQAVTTNKGSILMSRELVALDCHVPVPAGIDDFCIQSTDMTRLLGFLDSMEFTALRQDIEKYGF
jgi:DNA polymerase-1